MNVIKKNKLIFLQPSRTMFRLYQLPKTSHGDFLHKCTLLRNELKKVEEKRKRFRYGSQYSGGIPPGGGPSFGFVEAITSSILKIMEATSVADFSACSLTFRGSTTPSS